MRFISPNNFCPCGGGLKYKKCCQPKLSRFDENGLLIENLAGLIKEDGILEEQLQFFDREKEIALKVSKNDPLVPCICELKKCFCRNIRDYNSLRKILSINNPWSQGLTDPGFKRVVIEAASQFISQLNRLTEDEFVELHDAFDGIASLQFDFPKECRDTDNDTEES